jgi:hypothetical protein
VVRRIRHLRTVARATTAAAILAALFALLIAQAGSAHAGLTNLLPTPSSSSGDLLGGLTDTVGGLLPTESALPLPSLPSVGDVTGILPSPVQSVLDPVTGVLNDTITTVDDLLLPQDRSGGGTNGGGGTTTSGGGSSTTHGGSKTSKSASRSTKSTTSLGGVGAFTTVTGAQFRSPYGTTAGHAAAKAASRALHLMAPLAPALLLAAIAFGVLMMLTRGSQRLVKIDPSGIAKRTWRL